MNHVRVNAQLIDGETDAHLWADRFEENVADLFKLQDQVVARLANALGYELVKAEANKGAKSTNPDAVDLTMRGWALLWQQPVKERYVSARDFFERALKLDPQNAEAMVGLAYARIGTGLYGWSTAQGDMPAAPMQGDMPAAQMEVLTNALAINPTFALGYYVKRRLPSARRRVFCAHTPSAIVAMAMAEETRFFAELNHSNTITCE